MNENRGGYRFDIFAALDRYDDLIDVTCDRVKNVIEGVGRTANNVLLAWYLSGDDREYDVEMTKKFESRRNDIVTGAKVIGAAAVSSIFAVELVR